MSNLADSSRVQDPEVEKVPAEGCSSGPTPGTLKTGFWQAARVEFVKITLTKLVTHRQCCLPELVLQLSW